SARPRALHVGERAAADSIPDRVAADLFEERVRAREDLARAALDDAAGLPLDLVAEVLRGREDVAGALQREVAIHEERRVDRLAEHSEELDRLVRRDADQVEHRVVYVALEDISRLELRRRHPLDRVALEDLAHELSLRDLEEEAVLDPRVDLERVAEPE